MNGYKKLLRHAQIDTQDHSFMNKEGWTVLILSSVILWGLIIWVIV